jgi:hypothetical protein
MRRSAATAAVTRRGKREEEAADFTEMAVRLVSAAAAVVAD